MRKSIIALACVALAPLLTACGDAGSEFVGTWRSIKSTNTLKIERNGESFMVRTNEHGKETNYPATLQDGTLKIENSFGGISAAIDESTGHLNGGGIEFERMK